MPWDTPQPTDPGDTAPAAPAGRHAALALEQTLAQHRAVLAAARDPIITIDARGIILSASDSVRHVFGYEPAELMGRNIGALMPEPHRSAHNAYLANCLATGRSSVLGRPRRFDGRRKDGSTVHIEVSVSRADVPGSNEPLFIGIIRDLTEQLRAESEFKLIDDLALAIGEAPTAHDALDAALLRILAFTGWEYGEAWLPDADSETLAVAAIRHADHPALQAFAAATRLTRFARDQGLPGRAWRSASHQRMHDLSNAESFKRATAARQAGLRAGLAIPILTRGNAAAILVFLTRDHRPDDAELIRTVSTAAAPLGTAIERRRAEDELERYRKRLETIVAERTSELQATHEQLRLADRLAAIGTLAAGLGHDMNNVLFPIRCRLNALDAHPLPADLSEHLQAIQRSVAYLQRLSDGLHLLALDPEDSDASTEATDAAAWWSEAGPLLRKALPRHTVFEEDIPEDLPLASVAPHRLTQAVLNLIVNAGEAIEPGGCVLLWANASPDRRVVRIGVTDNGCGMTDEVRQRALDPFFSTKKRGLGTGLGLVLVHVAARSAGGSVSIDSTPGKGSTIVMAFPARLDDERHNQQTPSRKAAVSIADPRAATFVSAFLHAAGFDAYTAPPDTPGRPALWVTEPTQEALGAARRARNRHGAAHVLLFGTPSADWLDITATAIHDTHDFDRIREAITQAAAIVSGEPE